MRRFSLSSLFSKRPWFFGLRMTRHINVLPGYVVKTSNAGWKQKLRTRNMQQQVNVTIVGKMSMIVNVVAASNTSDFNFGQGHKLPKS